MSNTITVSTTGQINNNGFTAGKPTGNTYATTSSLFTSEIQIVPTAIAKLSASLGAYDWIQFINNDVSSSVAIYTDASSSNYLSTVSPNKPPLLLSNVTSSFYGKSFPNAAQLIIVGTPA